MSPRRRVHFGDETSESSTAKEKVDILRPLLTPSSEMSILDKRDLWWQPNEFDAFLENAKILATESRRFDSPNDDGCYAEVIRSVYWSCEGSKAKGPTRKQFHKLSQWIKVARTRRGLERVCVPEIGVSRSRRKKDVIRGVLRAQKKRQQNRSQKDKDVLLSMVSKTLTRPARLFAAVMGEADAHAASGIFEKEHKPRKNYAQQIESPKTPLVRMSSLKFGARILRRASCNDTSKQVSGARERKRRRHSSS
mmetsp:Transcript_17882/g.32325  ORF Transcript_17882/g.32325 Transcript_17882/m.32325 type:complete len:251 (-) Transcript_17882:1174-1926(-)|eukprot:CAMPEP_0202482084 /NCGR_PEP_ID=MMETSP1361-20130828/1530_1 /ASSEMBLY_ACC=CAM_ASM_000849 /TAXON_ID=210615 /ORGANISM="Staurosira complex sp., Strain CCMP2646" /LENGTH=250 /DNA_ID=CAMNT_0049109809 /DNA_START=79 /DNA_END=834 /DNA_ORIENTATION=+